MQHFGRKLPEGLPYGERSYKNVQKLPAFKFHPDATTSFK
jgi:hypothetical protein